MKNLWYNPPLYLCMAAWWALNLSYLSNAPTKGCLLLGLRGGSRGLGINEVITVRVPRIVYKCKGRSGRGGACLPASSSACILPQPSTCSVISTQQITLRSHEVPQASLTHQASKPNFQGKLTLQKAGEKGRLIKFPWPPFLTTSFRSEAQRQVPICKAAPGNTWPVAPTQWKGSRLWKRLLKFQQWECFSPRFLDKSFTSWWTPILQAYIKT